QELASMEPRLGGRGNTSVPMFVECLGKASMEPRLGGRGNSDCAGSLGGRTRSFNGATARRPWKLHQAVNDPPFGCVASMEPRLGGRGNTGTAWKGFPSGPSFNGATARRPWKQLGGKVPEC